MSQRSELKGSIFLKKDILLKGLMNSYMVCGIWQPVKFQLVSCSWNEMSFYRISELMLPTLIQRYDKKNIPFFIQLKNKRLTELLQAVRCHILWLY